MKRCCEPYGCFPEGFFYWFFQGILLIMDDIKQVKHLAELARIDITDEEAVGFQADFKNILGFVDQISEVDISLDKSQYRGPVVNVLREDDDSYTAGEFTEDIMENASETRDGYVKVQKIL